MYDSAGGGSGAGRSRAIDRDEGLHRPGLNCHNFSDIRRRPLVIGRLDQVQLPFVMTMPQIVCGAFVFGVLLATRAAWGPLLSDRLHIVVFVAAPILVAQQVTRTSIEGRSLLKAVLAFVRLFFAPVYGRSNDGAAPRPKRTAVVIAPLIDAPAAPEATGSSRRRRVRDRVRARNQGRNQGRNQDRNRVGQDRRWSA